MPCLLSLMQAATPVVCLDPGHTSEVGAGARGKKTTELRVAWEVSQLLANRLRSQGVRVVMTKTAIDQRVSNADRARTANDARANLFLRLHCDAAPTRGFAVYYPDREGEAHGRTGPSPQVAKTSGEMARAFQAAMVTSLGKALPSRALKTDRNTMIGRKQGALTGSIFSEVPTILVEMIVITNPTDEAFILTKVGRDKMVEALATATLAALKVKA